jgi:hypothetical protein
MKEAEMRHGTRVLLMVAACLISSACITSFKHPLGAVEDGFIEPHLLGTWACTAVDDPTPSLITILNFDGKQYYIQSSGGGKNEPSHSRALATRIEELAFLSVRELGPNGDDEWTFLEYSLSDADHLKFRLVDPARFEDVVDDPPSVRQRLAEQIQDPEVLVGLLSCTRQGPQG